MNENTRSLAVVSCAAGRACAVPSLLTAAEADQVVALHGQRAANRDTCPDHPGAVPEWFIERARALHPGSLLVARVKASGDVLPRIYEVEVSAVNGPGWAVGFDAETGGLLYSAQIG